MRWAGNRPAWHRLNQSGECNKTKRLDSISWTERAPKILLIILPEKTSIQKSGIFNDPLNSWAASGELDNMNSNARARYLPVLAIEPRRSWGLNSAAPRNTTTTTINSCLKRQAQNQDANHDWSESDRLISRTNWPWQWQPPWIKCQRQIRSRGHQKRSNFVNHSNQQSDNQDRSQPGAKDRGRKNDCDQKDDQATNTLRNKNNPVP